jgi:tagatose 1,6-diphosphate aldolase GatY/KbaY
MALISTKEILAVAEKEKGFAIGAFNVHNMEYTQAVVKAAEELKAPVILMLGEPMIPYMGLDMMVAITKEAASKAKVPVAIALDHGKDMNNVNRSIELGISIMYDGSHYGFEENVQKTRSVVEYAHSLGISVEAELGSLAGSEDSEAEGTEFMTDPHKAKEFVQATNIDILAISIGNQHGLYKGEQKIDIDRLTQIRKMVDVPIVMHGGSDLREDLAKAVIREGITKFNIGTDLKYAFTQTLRNHLIENPDIFQPPHVLSAAREAVYEETKKKLELFNSINKAALY